MNRILFGLLALVVCTQLTACLSSDNKPDTPVVSTPQYGKDRSGVNSVLLTWTPVSRATYYSISKDPTGSSGYSPVCKDNNPAATFCVDTFTNMIDLANVRYKVYACNSGGCTVTVPVAVYSTIKTDVPAVSTRYAKNTKQVLLEWPTLPRAAYYTISKDPSGSSGFTPICQSDTPVATFCLDNFNNVADLVNATYKVSACNSGGCVESAPIKAFTTQSIAYLKSDATTKGDIFGYSMALSGDGTTLAVGAPGEGSGSGAVHVFTRDGAGVWVQQALLQASNLGGGDQFGSSLAVSVDGNTVAVGAPKEDSSATGSNGNQSNESATDSGAVYVFTRTTNNNVSTWSQQAYLKASNTEAGDDFGYSLALSDSGNTLAVGADFEDSSATGINGDQADNSTQNSGAVYVFTRNATTWSQQVYLKASNTGAQDAFGYSLGLSGDGNTLAVGAVGEDSNTTGVEGIQTDNSAANSGAAYIFIRSGGIWSQQAYIKASNTDINDVFGSSIALSLDGNTLAVGAIQESSNATDVNGNQSDNSKQNSGAIYVFTRVATTWSQQAYLKSSNSDIADGFGFSVSLSEDGGTLAVGAALEDSFATGVNGDQADNRAVQSGAVYLFTRNGGNWTQKSYIKASNTGGYVDLSTSPPQVGGAQFGYSVALSADGGSLAVGAKDEGSKATGINGDQSDFTGAPRSGAVYVY